MTSNPTSEGLVERLNIAERRWFITSAQQQLLSDAADRIEALEAQLEGAKEALRKIKTLKSEPIGDTGFSVGPAALLRRAQEIARDTLKETDSGNAVLAEQRHHKEARP